MRTFKYRWSSAFGLSFLCHGIVLSAVAGLLFLFPPAQPSREPIEVDLVSDVGGGGGGGGGGAKRSTAYGTSSYNHTYSGDGADGGNGKVIIKW